MLNSQRDFFIEEKKQEPAHSKGYRMHADYEVKYPFPALSIDGSTLINQGEIFTLVALPGSGKTQIVELIVCIFLARILDVEIDNNGIELGIPRSKRLLYIDTERPTDDCSASFTRIRRRMRDCAGLIDEQRYLSQVDFLCFSGMSREECCKNLEDLLQTGNYGMVILDGVLDFAPGLNADTENMEFVRGFLRLLAEKYELAMMVTIHPNKGTDTIAGNLGSYLYRWCRAMLLIRKVDGIRELTSEFPQGKLSKSNKPISIFFRWDEQEEMMMPCDKPEQKKPQLISSSSIVEKIFREKQTTQLSASELTEAYMKAKNVREESARKHIAGLVDDGFLQRFGKSRGTYYKIEFQNNDDPAPF